MPESGLLMSYGTDFGALFQRGAMLVDKFRRGARPSHIPVEQPTKFELIVNNDTAKSIGSSIAPTLLARADRVIE